MSVKINLPKFQGKTYEQYRIELTAWSKVTDSDDRKQGIAIALSFPDQDEHKLREKVFSELSINDLKAENGFDVLNYKKRHQNMLMLVLLIIVAIVALILIQGKIFVISVPVTQCVLFRKNFEN